MFTGIIQSLGQVKKAVNTESGREFQFECREIIADISPGDSVCCSGVCLSASELTENAFSCYAVNETLEKTNLKNLNPGEKVNLELAMLPQTRIGGHFVNGHVDATAKVTNINRLPDETAEVTFSIPHELNKYCIAKGSIALNGVSLTIARISGDDLTVALIPVTLESTNLGGLKINDEVNMEVDSTGKYIETFFKNYLHEENPSFFEKLVK